MTRRVSWLACAATVAAILPGSAASSASADAETDRVQILSNERTVSRWANAISRSRVRSAPRAGARIVGRLRFSTEYRRPEVYMALRSARDSNGTAWVQVRVPGRPNGTIGWVPRVALGAFRKVSTHLRVNRRTLRATLYKGGRKIWSSRVGVGSPGTPTPGGRFYIRERLRGLGSGVYGPVAFGTSAYSSLSEWPRGGVVGIHGTNRPDLIPGRPSHGCVRVPNGSIRRLSRLMPIGTPVHIL